MFHTVMVAVDSYVVIWCSTRHNLSILLSREHIYVIEHITVQTVATRHDMIVSAIWHHDGTTRLQDMIDEASYRLRRMAQLCNYLCELFVGSTVCNVFEEARRENYMVMSIMFSISKGGLMGNNDGFYRK